MPREIIGREKEKNELLDTFHSTSGEFVVLYGRRRIGKTYLITSLFEEIDCFFVHATGIQHTPKDQQLNEFTSAVGNTFYGGTNLNTDGSWMNAFEILTNAIKQHPDKKTVIFLDELPWMCTAKSGLIAALDYFMDT